WWRSKKSMDTWFLRDGFDEWRSEIKIGRKCVRMRRSGFLVEIQHQLVADRKALAAEHEAARHFVVFEREVRIHVHLAVDNLAAAGGAHAALARVRQVYALLQRRIEHAVAVLVDEEAAAVAVLDHGDFALALARRGGGIASVAQRTR